MNSGSFKSVIYKMCLEGIYSIYMYKKDLALSNLQLLICHVNKPNQTNQLFSDALWSGVVRAVRVSSIV